MPSPHSQQKHPRGTDHLRTETARQRVSLSLERACACPRQSLVVGEHSRTRAPCRDRTPRGLSGGCLSASMAESPLLWLAALRPHQWVSVIRQLHRPAKHRTDARTVNKSGRRHTVHACTSMFGHQCLRSCAHQLAVHQSSLGTAGGVGGVVGCSQPQPLRTLLDKRPEPYVPSPVRILQPRDSDRTCIYTREQKHAPAVAQSAQQPLQPFHSGNHASWLEGLCGTDRQIDSPHYYLSVQR